MEFCFLPCDVDHANNHFVVRDPFQFSCYIYNNGNPLDPNLTPRELITLLGNTFVTRGTSLPQSQENRICNGLRIGDETLEIIGQQLGVTGLSNSNPPFYCLPFCDEFNFQDFETTDNPLPCFIEFHGTMMETLVSRLTRLIEPAMENEREICPFTGLNDDRNNCRSSISKMCRANRKVNQALCRTSIFKHYFQSGSISTSPRRVQLLHLPQWTCRSSRSGGGHWLDRSHVHRRNIAGQWRTVLCVVLGEELL